MSRVRIQLATAEDLDVLKGHGVKIDGHVVGHIKEQVVEIDVEPGWHIIEVLDIFHPTAPLRFLARDDRITTTEISVHEPKGVLYNTWFDHHETPHEEASAG